MPTLWVNKVDPDSLASANQVPLWTEGSTQSPAAEYVANMLSTVGIARIEVPAMAALVSKLQALPWPLLLEEDNAWEAVFQQILPPVSNSRTYRPETWSGGRQRLMWVLKNLQGPMPATFKYPTLWQAVKDAALYIQQHLVSHSAVYQASIMINNDPSDGITRQAQMPHGDASAGVLINGGQPSGCVAILPITPIKSLAICAAPYSHMMIRQLPSLQRVFGAAKADAMLAKQLQDREYPFVRIHTRPNQVLLMDENTIHFGDEGQPNEPNIRVHFYIKPIDRGPEVNNATYPVWYLAEEMQTPMVAKHFGVHINSDAA